MESQRWDSGLRMDVSAARTAPVIPAPVNETSSCSLQAERDGWLSSSSLVVASPS